MSPLARLLTTQLRTAFEDVPMEFKSDGDVIVTIAPKWEGFGPITLYDDTTEITINFGTFTHSHFVGSDWYDSDAS